MFVKRKRQPGRRWRRAFTMIDLLAVLLIVCFLSALAFSGPLTRARETANRIKCGSNLRQIGQGILLYANENKGNYPRTIYVPGEPVAQYTGVECNNPFEGADRPKNNDITAAFFLLLRTQDIRPEAFICPSTDATPTDYGGAARAQDRSNFASEQNLSYSLANVYPAKDVVMNGGYRVNTTVGAEFAVAADMNPGKVGEFDVTPASGPKDERALQSVMRKANSMNHRGDGMNVLYGDGHVEFQQNPFCGTRRDNIYTVSGGTDGLRTTSETIVGSPKWSGDSVLLPAATRNPHKKTPEQEEKEEIAALQLQIADQFKRMDVNTPEFQAMKRAIESKLAEQGDNAAVASAVATPAAAPANAAANPSPAAVSAAPDHSNPTTMLLVGIAIGVGISLLVGGLTWAVARKPSRTA